MHKVVEFSREELFEKVWSIPLLRLAKEIGVSDVALAKACRRAEIPLPGRGFWAKNARLRQQKPALPKLTDSHDETVSFRVLDPQYLKPARPALPKGEPIAVSENLESAHPIVAKTLRIAEKAKTSDGRLLLDRKRVLDLRISPDALHRALLLSDALIKASEAKGYAWKVTPEGSTTVTADGETMKVVIKERLSRRELTPPPSERDKRPNFSAYFYPRYEWLSTGILTFQIEEYVSTQKNWNDTKRTRLEDKLHEILAGFAAAAESIKESRKQREEQKQRWEEEERQRIARARQAEEQRRLRLKLTKATERWEKACRIRAFCQAASEQAVKLPPSEQATAVAWLEWANRQADMLDLLQGNPAELFCLHAEVESWFTGSYYQQHKDPDWWSP